MHADKQLVASRKTTSIATVARDELIGAGHVSDQEMALMMPIEMS
jgi:hypothetical protein